MARQTVTNQMANTNYGDEYTNDERTASKYATNEPATNEQEFEFYARIYCYWAGVEGARHPQDKNILLGYRTLSIPFLALQSP